MQVWALVQRTRPRYSYEVLRSAQSYGILRCEASEGNNCDDHQSGFSVSAGCPSRSTSKTTFCVAWLPIRVCALGATTAPWVRLHLHRTIPEPPTATVVPRMTLSTSWLILFLAIWARRTWADMSFYGRWNRRWRTARLGVGWWPFQRDASCISRHAKVPGRWNLRLRSTFSILLLQARDKRYYRLVCCQATPALPRLLLARVTHRYDARHA